MSEKITNYGYVYCIENLLNGRRYIGAKFGDSTPIEIYHGQSKTLNEDIKILGIKNFRKIIIAENITTEDNYLNDLEQHCIGEFKTYKTFGGYNLTTTGGSCYVHSNNTKNKMKNTMKMFSDVKKKAIVNKRLVTISNFSDEKRKNIANKLSNTISNFSDEKKENKRIKTINTIANFSDEKRKNIANKLSNTISNFSNEKKKEISINASNTILNFSDEKKKELKMRRLETIANFSDEKTKDISYRTSNTLSHKDILIDNNGKIFKPLNTTKFCKENKVAYSLLNRHKNEFIDKYDIGLNLNTICLKTSENTIGWCLMTNDFAKENGFIN